MMHRRLRAGRRIFRTPSARSSPRMRSRCPRRAANRRAWRSAGCEGPSKVLRCVVGPNGPRAGDTDRRAPAETARACRRGANIRYQSLTQCGRVKPGASPTSKASRRHRSRGTFDRASRTCRPSRRYPRPRAARRRARLPPRGSATARAPRRRRRPQHQSSTSDRGASSSRMVAMVVSGQPDVAAAACRALRSGRSGPERPAQAHNARCRHAEHQTGERSPRPPPDGVARRCGRDVGAAAAGATVDRVPQSGDGATAAPARGRRCAFTRSRRRRPWKAGAQLVEAPPPVRSSCRTRTRRRGGREVGAVVVHFALQAADLLEAATSHLDAADRGRVRRHLRVREAVVVREREALALRAVDRRRGWRARPRPA